MNWWNFRGTHAEPLHKHRGSRPSKPTCMYPQSQCCSCCCCCCASSSRWSPALKSFVADARPFRALSKFRKKAEWSSANLTATALRSSAQHAPLFRTLWMNEDECRIKYPLTSSHMPSFCLRFSKPNFGGYACI